MPAIREHDTLSNMDDDDGMPPLVDNPNPSMTFTFFTDMTPITALSADPTVPFETVWENPPPEDIADPIMYPSPDRSSHAKKRDASYIPRPPNAFILFRSSFIRSQQVPEKVEGNHSTLSKIIGKYWKTLPREEREVWEAKALVAQAEHRKRYPDWRFRPGANAFAKLKIKDGPQTSNRKRASQTGRKIKGDPTTKKTKSGDERCAMIADLLVEGKTGIDLEDAVRRWEDSTGKGGGKDTGAGKESGNEREAVVEPSKAVSISNLQVTMQPDKCDGDVPSQLRAQTPDAAHDDRFRIPLTAMFRRSLSAPAGQPSPPVFHQRHNSLDSVFCNVSYDMAESPQESFNGDLAADFAHTILPDSIGSLSPLMLPSVLPEGDPARWNNPFNLLETSIGLPPTPECPGLTYTLHTPPAVSPVSPPFSTYDFCPADPLMSATYDRSFEPKNWAEALPEQMPIFINAYAGNAYDWCTPAQYGCETNAGYSYDDPFGDDYVRVGECLPAVAF